MTNPNFSTNTNGGGATYAERAAKDRETRLQVAKKRRRKEVALKVVAGIAAVVAVLLLVALIVLFGGLLFYIAWNVGVVALVAAAGGHVAHIGFWTAVGGSLLVGVIQRAVHGTPTVQAKS